MAQTTELLAPGTLIRGQRAEYRIMGLIGRGGMGAVYRANRTADGTIWALKEMRPPDDASPTELDENRRLFIQEAELLGRLRHPALPVMAELFAVQGRPTMVMEYVAGKTLEATMRDANAPLTEQVAVGYTIQVARVLHYLHTRQPPIIYRDLKPSNVMLTPEGVIKLLDFGVARTYKARQTKDTIAMGSAGYAPPEQYGKGQTDARSDVYALGATLLHLLTNLPPIPLQTPTPGSIRALNPSVDAETEQIVARAMEQRADARFADADAFERALHALLTTPFVDPTTRVAPPPPLDPPAAPIAPPATPARPATPAAATPVAATPAVSPDGVVCARCGRTAKPGARFCAGCGSALVVQPAAPTPRPAPRPAPTPKMPELRVTSPRGAWQQLVERTPLRIGRRDPRRSHYPELDLAEHDRGIASRNHAIISLAAGTYQITDLGSTNGTFLNGTALPHHEPKNLRSGDRIKIGEVEIEFRWQ